MANNRCWNLRAPLRTAIVGATGAVGSELLTLLHDRAFPFSRMRLVASRRSADQRLSVGDALVEVEALDAFDFSEVDLAFFSAGTDVSGDWVPRAVAAGCLVIDNTNAFRMDAETPLVVPQVNVEAMGHRPASGVIANPNCSTIQLVRALQAVARSGGIEQVVVSTYQAASGGGRQGMDDLSRDAAAWLANAPPVEGSSRFPRPLAFNVVPQVDVMLPNHFTLEEQKLVQETRKIFTRPALRLTATAVRVPVMNGHSEAVYVEMERSTPVEAIVAALRSEEELVVHESDGYPTARELDNRNVVHVGRVRIDPHNPRGLWLWIVADNLRIGAALNAVQIAEQALALSRRAS